MNKSKVENGEVMEQCAFCNQFLENQYDGIEFLAHEKCYQDNIIMNKNLQDALNQQRSEVIREIKDNFRNDDFYNDDGSFKLGTFHSFLTKLEEEK